ncbi:MAG: DUF106 domain-containing protein [Candidatus Aenigmarchaeota archaeon]|nr:DUF106 domain-containing protein [Candidatus Aenigmarchaeota archaeon]
MTPFLEVTLISLGLSLLITLIYRFLTNPDEMRKIKDDMKFYKEKMNQAKKSGDTAKMNEYASEMMKMSQKQFQYSMKPMIATMLVFFLLLGWLNTSFGGAVVDFSKNETVFTYDGVQHQASYEKSPDGFITAVDLDNDGSFSDSEKFSKGDVFEYRDAYWRPVAKTDGFLFFTHEVEDVVHFEMLVAKMPFELPFLGSYLSWFWWYIFISFPATFILRKLFGVE